LEFFWFVTEHQWKFLFFFCEALLTLHIIAVCLTQKWCCSEQDSGPVVSQESGGKKRKVWALVDINKP
jgi:hypothetical protein